MATQKRSMPPASIAKAETQRTIEDIFDANYQASAFDPPVGGAGGAVTSVFGRGGAVVSALSDYATSQIDNDSTVSGATLNDAITTILESLFDNIIIVKQSNVATTLGGVIDPLKEYFIDGQIDMGSTSITVPSGGIRIRGYDFDTSGLFSTAVGYTMFTGATAGNVLMNDIYMEVSGVGSQIFNITGDTGFEAFEINRVNWNNCTSMGTISTYRQGLEVGTGRFGGTPTLTLDGTWVGGYFIDTSIVRNLDNAMNAPLYAVGGTFLMSSRFRSNQNIDLGTTAEFIDFSTANFTNPSTVQLDGCIISRNGVFDPNDATIIPNLSNSDLVSIWTDNIGISNTFVGGTSTVTTEITTTITVLNQWETLAGTWTVSDLQHFDSPVNGQLRHIGNSPREYRLIASINIEGTANDVAGIRVRRWDDSASGFVTECTVVRQINALVGGRDVAFYVIVCNVTLDTDDYTFLEVNNQTGTGNLTAELDSIFTIEQR